MAGWLGWIGGGMILLAACVSCAADQQGTKVADETDRKYREAEQLAHTHVTVSYGSVSVPVGRFLLIRNGNDVCAVRFARFQRGGDAKSPTVFHSGDETLYAEYDWFHQGDGTGDLTKQNVGSGHKELKRGPMVGIGRFAFQLGSTILSCGPFSLSWRYPNGVGFNTTYRKEGDVGNELAPTKWQSIRQVNPNDPSLRWYRFDEKRSITMIPLDAL